jgi:hypothetical protein
LPGGTPARHVRSAFETKAAMTKDRTSEDKERKLPSDEVERKALHLAETTDVSVRQAREMILEHGKDNPKVEQDAKNFKAEG